MTQADHDLKRKFLKTIYEIQESFGSSFGNISRNFSFGIKPTESIQKKLKIWFSQINEAKEQLYQEIYADYKQKPYGYLSASFDYGTFFKGGTTFGRIKTNRNLITSVPVIEGLRMEINGSIRSFITNHKRIFEENIAEIVRLKEDVSKNKASLQSITLDTENTLLDHLGKLEQQSYEDIICSFALLQEYENLLLAFNELVHWSQVKDFIKMSRPLNTGWLLLASGLTGALQNPQ